MLLTSLDFLGPVRRLLVYVRHRDKLVPKSFWKTVVLGQEPDTVRTNAPEYTGLIAQDTDGIEKEFDQSPHPRNSGDRDTLQWANNVDHHRRGHRYSNSVASDGTLFDSSSPCPEDDLQDLPRQESPKQPLFARVAHGIFAILERALVFGGYGVAVTGIVVYTGGCRENYVNGCMAHLISASPLSTSRSRIPHPADSHM